METQNRPDPVKYVIGVLFREKEVISEAIRVAAEGLGEVDHTSPDFRFDTTDYYEGEMGSPLYRRFYSFKELRSPGELADVKILTSRIEEQFAENSKRRVNLDPGYMDFGKFVLASFKYKANKIYLGQGVYADPTLYYEKGQFLPSPWSFPDMRTGLYGETFLHIRKLYREAMRVRKQGTF